MENIFEESKQGKNLKESVKALRDGGMSIREIAEKLGISKSAVHRLSFSVPEGVDLPRKPVPECPDIVPKASHSVPSVPEMNGNIRDEVAYLHSEIVKLKETLGEHYITKKEIKLILEEHLETLQERFEQRLEKYMSTYTERCLKPLIEAYMSKKQGLTEDKEGQSLGKNTLTDSQHTNINILTNKESNEQW